ELVAFSFGGAGIVVVGYAAGRAGFVVAQSKGW
ncbi:hypothetical protein ABIB48_003730, partial [Arthrobacter sp. UYCu511]